MIAKVRELRVFDIRCDLCDAAPAEPCRTAAGPTATHQARKLEHAELVAQGWEWQEVDPTDKGARKE